eukprot:UN22913
MIVIGVLQEYFKECKKLKLEVIEHKSNKNRGNLWVEFPAEDKRTITFVAHLDVVPANPKKWKTDPWSLTTELLTRDKMITARGVTDCLGHVCLLSSMMKTLSEDSENPSLNVICIFVGGHENVFDSQIGVTQLLETGKLDK